MINKNRYYYRSSISEPEFRQLVRCFALDFTATSTVQLIGISARSINSIYLKIRQRMAEACKIASPLKGAVEVDESDFGAHRVRGKRGRGPTRGQCKVYTKIVHDCSKAMLQGIIRGHVSPATLIHSDGWRGYDGLVDIDFDKHFRVNHGENEFANGERHINGIESFWSYAKRRLAKSNGIPKHTFYWHLTETECRFNHRRPTRGQCDNFYLELLQLLRLNPL